MSKKLILVLVGVVFLSKFNLARADVIIDEIAWKGTVVESTHEWLELANTGATTDISGWTIKDGANQLNITLPAGATIQGGGFYVIKRTTSDITPYDFSTAFSGGLSDAGEKLILADSTGAVKEMLDFSSGWPDPVMTSSQTMQWDSLSLSWFSGDPTPGFAKNNTTSPSTPDDNSSSNNSDTSSDTSNDTSSTSTPTIYYATATKDKTAVVQKIRTQITANNFGFVNSPVSLQVNTFGRVGEPMYSGKYFLNFGDGDSKEMSFPEIASFTHTYSYPGNYRISLSYYQYDSSGPPDATSQVNVKIVPANVVISNVGNEADFFVELSNNTEYDADISKWVLASDQNSFTFPRNTILETKNKMMISPKITNFTIADKDTLRLLNEEGDVVYDYSRPVVLAKIQPSKSPLSEGNLSPTPLLTGEGQRGEVNTLASAVSADPPQNDPPSSPNTIIIYFLSFIFIGISASAVYFIRRKKVAPQAGSDFEILDE